MLYRVKRKLISIALATLIPFLNTCRTSPQPKITKGQVILYSDGEDQYVEFVMGRTYKASIGLYNLFEKNKHLIPSNYQKKLEVEKKLHGFAGPIQKN